MNKKDQKISYYSLEFKENYNDSYFNKKEFIQLIDYISYLGLKDRILQKGKYNNDKALLMKDCYKLKNDVYQILFHSCKYNFSPDYISSLDGSVRPSDKRMHEGEKEKAHMVLKIKKEEALVILEKNHSGVSITQLSFHLNEFMKRIDDLNSRKNFCKIIYSIIPSDDFMKALKSTKRIRLAELFTSKEFIGSEFRALMAREDDTLREDILISLKPQKYKIIYKKTIKNLYNKLSAKDGKISRISRIRLYGKDKNDNKIKIDTKTFEKTEYVTTFIDDNGAVNTQSIFSSLVEVLNNFSEEWD